MHGVDKVEANERNEATPVPSPPAPAPALGSIVSVTTPIAPSAKDTLEKRWADYEKMIVYWKDNSYLNQVRYKHYFPGCRCAVEMFGEEDSVEKQLDNIEQKPA